MTIRRCLALTSRSRSAYYARLRCCHRACGGRPRLPPPSPLVPAVTAESTTVASFSTLANSSGSGVSKTSSDGVVGRPIDFDVAAKIEGNESQIVTIELEPEQVIRAESGALMYMTDGVEMNTTTGGGLSTGFQRMLTGQNFFVSDFSYKGEPGTKGVVALGTDFPSKILRLNVEEYGGKIVCQKGALLCASHTVNIEMEFTKKFSTGFFGGEGFILQALTGNGEVFVKAGGTLIRRDLEEGEQLRISSGCLVAFVDAEYGTFPIELSLLRCYFCVSLAVTLPYFTLQKLSSTTFNVQMFK